MTPNIGSTIADKLPYMKAFFLFIPPLFVREAFEELEAIYNTVMVKFLAIYAN